jgi:hypothetical protein
MPRSTEWGQLGFVLMAERICSKIIQIQRCGRAAAPDFSQKVPSKQLVPPRAHGSFDQKKHFEIPRFPLIAGDKMGNPFDTLRMRRRSIPAIVQQCLLLRSLTSRCRLRLVQILARQHSDKQDLACAKSKYMSIYRLVIERSG